MAKRVAKEKISGIYKIENKVNGKFYIGSAVDIHKRWREHRNGLKANRHVNTYLQRSFNKHGIDNFILSIIEVIIEKEILVKREQYWFDLLKPYNPKVGYNILPTAGSNLGHKHSDITIEKIKLSKQNISDEIRENMRLGQISIPILQINIEGTIVNEWCGAREVSKTKNKTRLYLELFTSY